ncbi:MAG: bifunctional diaminohydroxyphosphoribosylaminopyrimidine deaminase/5-amino-6-(5-phosphoribosylamino)uracil reductase RibD [Bacteroidia bacterium]|nr:bifunctional diaminohydroxyphosphoribosylaminopyrimidine deaminase/5-amino-6-(5-phosphoribosylamino)uracil reductase RibD [Bacteroidia bacterium]
MSAAYVYMKRCIELAAKGLGDTAPNPMVGCVIVNNDKIIGEGYHQQYGKAHAEVNAINSVQNKSLLLHSTLYVSLEPCSHHGKTPPCVELIISAKIPHVVIGSIDSNPLINKKGIQQLKNAGITIEYEVLNKECRELNKRFYTFYEKKRPFIILKWAQTADSFIDKIRTPNEVGGQLKISSGDVNALVHQWRSHEQALMIGTTTALLDNPQLNVRLVNGKNPLRIIIDKNLEIPAHYNLFDGSTPTLIFTNKEARNKNNISYITLSSDLNTIDCILNELYKRNIQSLIVEGGTKLISSFIKQNVWDEARVIKSNSVLHNGVKAPDIDQLAFVSELKIENDTVSFYRNSSPYA